MDMHVRPTPDRSERLGLATMALVRAQQERNTARTVAAGVRYLEPMLIPTAAGVWLHVALSVATGL
jgi:hypothetical protein